MPKGDNFGDVVPCSRWQEGKDDLPGFKYSPDENTGFNEWDFPCVTYDASNKTSKKEAMKMALKMGLQEMNETRKEIEKDMKKENY